MCNPKLLCDLPAPLRENRKKRRAKLIRSAWPQSANINYIKPGCELVGMRLVKYLHPIPTRFRWHPKMDLWTQSSYRVADPNLAVIKFPHLNRSHPKLRREKMLAP